MSNGDKILSENYLQHSDHFSRVLNIQEASKIFNLETSKTSENKIEEKGDEVKLDNPIKEESVKSVD